MSTNRAAAVIAAFSCGLFLGLAGCPGHLDDIEKYRPKDAGFVCPDIPATFVARCAGSSCHSAGNQAGFVDLVSAGIEQRTIGTQAKGCPGALVDPESPESSVLYRKLAESVSTCGVRMPLGGAPYTDEELVCVKDWIASLTPDAGPEAACAQCICTPGAVESCYSGPMGTENVGICKPGTRMCNPEGLTWGPCSGEVLPKPEQCLSPEDDDCNGDAPPCPEGWSFRVGDALTQYARAVATDPAGNVYVAGDFEGAVDFGGGPFVAASNKADVFVAKFDRFGNHVWSRQFGDASNQYALGIAVDTKGNVAVTGRVFGSIDFGGGALSSAGLDDVFVAKLNANGDYVFGRVLGDPFDQRGSRVAFDAAGNVVVAGKFLGTLPTIKTTLISAGGSDAFLLSLDGTSGDTLSALAFGGPLDDGAEGLWVDAASNMVISGQFAGTAAFGGTALSSKGGFDAFVAKVLPNGTLGFAQGFGSTLDDMAYDVDGDPSNGDLVVVGYQSGPIDFGGGPLPSAGGRDYFVARLSAQGAPVWSRGFGDALDQLQTDFEPSTRMSVVVDATGSATITGPLTGTVDFGGGPVASAGKSDVLLLRLNKAGQHQSSKAFGNAGTQVGLDIASSGSYVVLVGRFLSSVDFSYGTLPSAGDSDAFVAKVLP